MAWWRQSEFYRGPFVADLEDLLGRFQQTESVRFEDFSAVWKECDFCRLFFGIQFYNEKRTFTQVTLSVAYKYLLPPFSFQVRVGALYAIYGLYNTQIAWPKQKVRVPLKDWYDVQRLIEEAQTCQHLDVVYVFKKLISAKAFCFTAMPKKLSFDPIERYKHNINDEFRASKDAVVEVASTEMLEEIENVHHQYEKLKKATLVTPSVVTLLNLPDSVRACVLEYQQWRDKIAATKKKDSEKQAETTQSEASIRAEKISSIKSKSYGNLSKEKRSRRHRQGELAKADTGSDAVVRKSRRYPSLKTRTCRTFSETVKTDVTKHWVFGAMEEDKTALKRKTAKRFKW